MAGVAETHLAEWQPREAQSLAGQMATVIQRDGTRKEIRFGADVRLRRGGGRPPGASTILQPVVEGHLAPSERGFDPDDQQLVLRDGSVFRISFSYRGFFFAVEPLTSKNRVSVEPGF
jgi:hypothetical protein